MTFLGVAGVAECAGGGKSLRTWAHGVGTLVDEAAGVGAAVEVLVGEVDGPAGTRALAPETAAFEGQVIETKIVIVGLTARKRRFQVLGRGRTATLRGWRNRGMTSAAPGW